MSMSKKRRFLWISKWFFLFLLLFILWNSIGEGDAKESGRDSSVATFLQEGLEKLGQKMVDSQSVVMDLLAGSEPVFFEDRKAGVQESGLPFSLKDPYFYPDEDSLKQFQEENRLYQEKLAEGAASNQEEASGGEEGAGQEEKTEFVAAGEKSQFISWENYRDVEKLLQGFYTVDSTTEAIPELFQLNTLKEMDLSIDQETQGPQILLYHTHSQETFVDSVPGDISTSIVGVGEVLASLLEGYGYKVLHHQGQYDVEVRDYAYSNSLAPIEQILKDNPSIQVVIDLHRDAVGEDTKLVTQVAGRPTAKVMFFNGLSRSKTQGAISYLENPYLQENLAFSFQMKALCDEYYPGFARDIYLRAYRYNMHVAPKTLLIELGAQTNTVEEIHNALEPLAHILDKVLSGKE